MLLALTAWREEFAPVTPSAPAEKSEAKPIEDIHLGMQLINSTKFEQLQS